MIASTRAAPTCYLCRCSRTAQRASCRRDPGSACVMRPHPMPACASFARNHAMKNLGQNLGAMDDSHAGAIQKQIAIGKGDVALTTLTPFTPPGILFKYRQLLHCAFELKPACSHHKVLGISGQ